MLNSRGLSEEVSKKLGEYVEKLRIESNFGFNQLSIKSGLNAKTLNEILNGKSKRTNPFHLQRLGVALRIDYKDLYKIVGYLSEDDFKESDNLKLELKNYKIKYEELEKEINDLKSKKSLSSENQDKKNEINLSGLSPERIEELKRYAEFLKTK
ncbi:MAG: hypothetical protein ACRC54_08275 [Fusobacteriaceae bacterium]